MINQHCVCQRLLIVIFKVKVPDGSVILSIDQTDDYVAIVDKNKCTK